MELSSSLSRLSAAHVARAFVRSFATLAIFSLAAGMLYVPYDQWCHGQRHLTVLDCRILPGDPSAISVVREQTDEMEARLEAKLVLHDLSATAATRVVNWPGSPPSCISVNADRRRAIIGTSNGDIFYLDTADALGSRRFLGTHGRVPAEFVASSPDGRIVVSSGFQSFHAWNLKSHAPLWSRLDLHVNSFAICSNDSLICGTQSGEIVELNLNTGRSIRTLARHRSAIHYLDIFRNQKLVVVGAGGDALLFERERPNGRWGQQPAGEMFTGNNRMAFSPDGECLVGVSRNSLALVCWSVEDRQPIRELKGHQGPIVGARFLPDGTLMSWGTDGTIRTWSLDAPTALRLANHAFSKAPG